MKKTVRQLAEERGHAVVGKLHREKVPMDAEDLYGFPLYPEGWKWFRDDENTLYEVDKDHTGICITGFDPDGLEWVM